MLVKIRNIFIAISIIIIFLVSFMGHKGELVENLGIPAGVGTDIEKASGATVYSIPFLIYTIENDKVTTAMFTGKSVNLGETRENRQIQCPKKMLTGLNTLYIYSDTTARNGIRPYNDINVNNPEVNDRAYNVVCKGNCEDILNFKPKAYPNSAEFIKDMVSNLSQYNFFSQQYTIIDLVTRIDAEGRNSLLPYIEINNDNIETTGLAIFKGSKMIGKADMSEAKIINMLKDNNVKGLLTLQMGTNKYINCYAHAKRKIECYEKDGQYNFIINLNLNSDIISNELYSNLENDVTSLKGLQKNMEETTEKLCNDSIKEIQEKYKTDVLDLGRVAAAKYGRGTGTDWNEAVSNSNIKVNVKFTINTEGRGNY